MAGLKKFLSELDAVISKTGPKRGWALRSSTKAPKLHIFNAMINDDKSINRESPMSLCCRVDRDKGWVLVAAYVGKEAARKGFSEKGDSVCMKCMAEI